MLPTSLSLSFLHLLTWFQTEPLSRSPLSNSLANKYSPHSSITRLLQDRSPLPAPSPSPPAPPTSLTPLLSSRTPGDASQSLFYAKAVLQGKRPFSDDTILDASYDGSRTYPAAREEAGRVRQTDSEGACLTPIECILFTPELDRTVEAVEMLPGKTCE